MKIFNNFKIVCNDGSALSHSRSLTLSRRKFGSDGWAYKDMDTADEKHPRDHVHDMHRGRRFDARKPNKFEKQEFKKAKKKRRFL